MPRAFKSPLLIFVVCILVALCLFPLVGVGLLSLFLIFLVEFPHHLPVSLLNEITLVNLIVRAKMTCWRVSLNQGWWHEIVPGLYLGGIPLAPHLAELQRKGVRAVYAILDDQEANLETFFCRPLREKDWIEAGVSYARLKSPDMQPLSLQQLKQATEWIHLQRSAGKPIYVHCKGGRERSPMVVMAYLMRYHHLSLAAAKDLVLQRPLVRFRPSQDLRMKEFEQNLI